MKALSSRETEAIAEMRQPEGCSRKAMRRGGNRDAKLHQLHCGVLHLTPLVMIAAILPRLILPEQLGCRASRVLTDLGEAAREVAH